MTLFNRCRTLPILIVFAAVIAWFAPNAVKAEAGEKPIRVLVDVQAVEFDVDPFIDDGVTLVEIRSLFEKLGITLDWKSGSSVIKGAKDKTSFSLTIGSSDAVVNGDKVKLAVPARVVNGRTVVPLRFVAEATGAVVAWDHVNREINVLSEAFLDSLGATKEDAQRWIDEYLASLETGGSSAARPEGGPVPPSRTPKLSGGNNVSAASP